jgi:phage baseplate assembly protein W
MATQYTRNLSDKSGTTHAVSVVSRGKPYSDLDLSLKLHPIRKDIIPLRDDAAVKNAVKNLLLTNFYERPFQPAIGANLRGLLFEPADAITRLALRENIKGVIEEYEPRVSIQNIRILDDSDNNSYHITVTFLIKEFDSSQEVQILLRRLR